VTYKPQSNLERGFPRTPSERTIKIFLIKLNNHTAYGNDRKKNWTDKELRNIKANLET
jgi:hypothetical protein